MPVYVSDLRRSYQWTVITLHAECYLLARVNQLLRKGKIILHRRAAL